MRFCGIDPGTHTGFVALDDNGGVLVAKELSGHSKDENLKLVELENELYKHLSLGDEIVIEGPAMGTQKGITTGMVHGGLRSMIIRKGLALNLVNPMWTKKYVGVTGWVGEKGNKRRLVDKEKKAAVKAAVTQHFGWTHKSHNVVDAYIIARIALNVYRRREYLPLLDTESYQIEVIDDILREKVAK
jgi:crossover junction endodeoxyribonuclease RuvC